MSDLPETLGDLVVEHARSSQRAAWVRFDETGRVVSSGGDLELHGIGDLEPGTDLRNAVPFAEGVVPLTSDETLRLPRVATTRDVYADVAFHPEPPGGWLLLLDVSRNARREQASQQRANELELLLSGQRTGARVTAESLLNHLDIVILQPDGEDTLQLLGTPPSWLTDLSPEGSATGAVEMITGPASFLEHFLEDARAFWSAGGAGCIRSGPWSETAASGEEVALEAMAFGLPETDRTLVVQRLGQTYQQHSEVIQKARTATLEHLHLLDEVAKKELLLHCIVHDLGGPLGTIVGSLSMLKKGIADATSRDELIELALGQAHRQREMIGQILDVFAAEIRALEAVDPQPVNLRERAGDVARRQRPAFEQEGVHLNTELDGGGDGVVVLGRGDRFDRVVTNLLQNALRHAPPGSTVTLGVVDEGQGGLLWVDDEGPGVAPEVAGTLFEKFVRSESSGGAAGLGLYFCRTTIERWGGHIGHRAREPQGARFWIRLPRARTPGG